MIIRSILLAACLGTPLSAQTPFLDFPLDCTLGQTCFVEDYMDVDPGRGQKDYTCGIKSRNKHGGTDIALLSFDALTAGVDVLAAADGVVLSTRDGMTDIAHTPDRAQKIKGRACGNLVRIEHSDGYQTLYCHLKRGSLRVRSKQKVSAGQPIGQVGLSGLTNYPHLHFTVFRNRNRVDPFSPGNEKSCGAQQPTLWTFDFPYHMAGIFTAGFAIQRPDLAAIRSGEARVKKANSDNGLFLYGSVFLAKKGDVISFSVQGPEGEVFSSEIIKDNKFKTWAPSLGRNAPKEGWPIGSYYGTIKLSRKGTVIAVRHADIVVE